MPTQDAATFAKLEDARVWLHIECVFVFSLVWSIGSSCATNQMRIHFDAFLRAAVSCQLRDYESPSGERYVLPEDIPEGHVTLSTPIMPGDGGALVYDYVYDVQNDRWERRDHSLARSLKRTPRRPQTLHCRANEIG